MTRTNEVEMTKVTSRDGTEIAYWTSGEGPPVCAAPTRAAHGHTITRELRAFSSDRFDPEEAARITVPVLLLTGSDTPEALKGEPETVAAALADARIVVIPGQQHLADVLVPESFAGHVVDFLEHVSRKEM